MADHSCVMLKRTFLFALLALVWLASPLHAACYADYKASRDNPFRLHYGVMRIDTDPCRMSNAVQSAVANRLGAAGWKLLGVQSVFDDSGLGKRKKDAGQYFLRF